jgi:predicted nuclease of predicted toxin-antitoxin system
MNLSPEWAAFLVQQGHAAVHWREVGAHSAPDQEIMDWAANDQRAVLTADHDFAAAVATRGLSAPSVVQLRMANTDPRSIGSFVSQCISAAARELTGGAILTIELGHARLRPGFGNQV